MKKLLTIFFVVVMIGFTGCNGEKPSAVIAENKPSAEVKLKIIVTNKLIYHFVKDIVKNKGTVDYMFNNLNDEWDFNYTDDSLTNISNQDLFIYVGSGFEPWIDGFVSKLDKNKVGAINSSRGVKILQYNKAIMYKNTLLKDNPYYWLSSANYKMMMVNIKNAIEDKDPLNRSFYENNFKDISQDIDSYEKAMEAITDQLKNYTFVTDSDDYDYFLKSFGLKEIKIDDDSLRNNPDDTTKLESELSSLKDIAFIYSDDNQITNNEDYINKYSMKKVKLYIYDDYFNYSDLMWGNIANFKRLITDVQKK